MSLFFTPSPCFKQVPCGKRGVRPWPLRESWDLLVHSKTPGGYLDVRSKGRAPGSGGRGEIMAGNHQARHQKCLASSPQDAPARHTLTCSAQARQTPTSLPPPPDTCGRFWLYTDRFCCHRRTVIPRGRTVPPLWGKSQRQGATASLQGQGRHTGTFGQLALMAWEVLSPAGACASSGTR